MLLRALRSAVLRGQQNKETWGNRTLTASEPQAKAEQFNCAQRAHANFLENAPQTMLFTLVAGLKYPQLATAIGGAWLVLRTAYLYGYVYSGKPQGKGRMMGGLFWFAQAALWGMSVFGVGRDLMSL